MAYQSIPGRFGRFDWFGCFGWFDWFGYFAGRWTARAERLEMPNLR